MPAPIVRDRAIRPSVDRDAGDVNAKRMEHAELIGREHLLIQDDRAGRSRAEAARSDCRPSPTDRPPSLAASLERSTPGRGLRCLRPIRDRNRDHVQPLDAGEVVGVARVNGEAVGEGRGSDQRIVGACGRLPSRAAERCRDATEGSRRARVERERVEIRFGLLEVRLSSNAIFLAGRNQGAHRELSERDRRDQRLEGERLRVLDPRQQDEGARVQHSALVPHRIAQTVASTTASRSALSFRGSTRGRARHRSRSASARSPRAGSGRNSATALPERVTVNVSPRATRSRIRPPWLRRSRTVTLPMAKKCITRDTCKQGPLGPNAVLATHSLARTHRPTWRPNAEKPGPTMLLAGPGLCDRAIGTAGFEPATP